MKDVEPPNVRFTSLVLKPLHETGLKEWAGGDSVKV